MATKKVNLKDLDKAAIEWTGGFDDINQMRSDIIIEGGLGDIRGLSPKRAAKILYSSNNEEIVAKRFWRAIAKKNPKEAQKLIAWNKKMEEEFD